MKTFITIVFALLLSACGPSIKDNPDILTIMEAAWDGATDMDAVATKLLSDTRLWGEDLTRVSGLVEQVSAALSRIRAVGVKAAMSELCS